VLPGVLLLSFLQWSDAFPGFRVLPAVNGAETDEGTEMVCRIQDPALLESSGIAISRHRPDAVWIHNDSGDSARLFLVGLDGRTLAIATVRNTEPLDWEDLCSFEMAGEKWLMIGDIGDNARRRGKSASACQLLLLKEPKIEVESAANPQPVELSVDVVSVTEFSFPDGPEDCEGLAVDTKRQEILLITKTNPLKCQLFRLPLSLQPGNHTGQAVPVAKLSIPWATAMDISSDGLQLAVVNMFSGALVEREDSESWSDACQRPVTVLTLPPRLQGESVCFELDGNALLLNSEGRQQPLWRVRLRQPVQPQ